eukprot:gene9205-19088_t
MLGLKFLLILGCLSRIRSSSSLIFGAVMKDSVVLTASRNLSPNGATTIRQDYDWVIQIGDKVVVAVNGDSSDCEHLLGILMDENREYFLTLGRNLPCKLLANFCRRLISEKIRSPSRLKANFLFGGWDDEMNSPVLIWVDSVGAVQEVQYAAHGVEFSSILSILDRYIPKSLDSTDGIELFRTCWNCVKKRSTRNIGDIGIYSITSSGIQKYSEK